MVDMTPRYDTGVEYCTRCWKHEVELDVLKIKQSLHRVRDPQRRRRDYSLYFMLSQLMMLLHANVGSECQRCRFRQHETVNG